MYYNGEGVPKDDKTAVKWRKLAAEQGNADAQHDLGWMYEYGGGGVRQNDVYAHVWWNIAASSGKMQMYPTKNAEENRDLIANRMNSSQLEKAQDLAVECVRKKYKGC